MLHGFLFDDLNETMANLIDRMLENRLKNVGENGVNMVPWLYRSKRYVAILLFLLDMNVAAKIKTFFKNFILGESRFTSVYALREFYIVFKLHFPRQAQHKLL